MIPSTLSPATLWMIATGIRRGIGRMRDSTLTAAVVLRLEIMRRLRISPVIFALGSVVLLLALVLAASIVLRMIDIRRRRVRIAAIIGLSLVLLVIGRIGGRRRRGRHAGICHLRRRSLMLLVE